MENDESKKKVGCKILKGFQRILFKVSDLKVHVEKGEERVLKLPLLLVVLAFFLGFYFVMISIGIILITKSKVRLSHD